MVKVMADAREIIMIMVRSFLAILSLLVITRILGKKQISQLTIYDYVIGITMGSIAADSIVSLDEHFINGIVALFSFGGFVLLLSYLAIKNKDVNLLLNGKSVILMEKGEFNFDNLRKTKIPILKFIEQCRLKGYYDISQIDYAILETNGQISFLVKKEYQITDDKNSKNKKQVYQFPLIVDGSIEMDVLNEMGKDIDWLRRELKKQKVNDEAKLLLATIDDKKRIKIYRKWI